jgi:uncharacterized membrane protein YqjE
MEGGEPHTDGWRDSLRRMGGSLLGLAQSRFELFAVELQEEKLRALDTLVWLVVAFALLVAGMLVGLGTLAFYLWAVAGYGGLVGLAIVLIGAAAALLRSIRLRILRGPTPFAETITEFRKDRECWTKDP